MPKPRAVPFLLAVLAILAAAPVGAAPTPAKATMPPGATTPTVDRMMVWDVPAAVTLAGPAELRVEVLRDGATVYAERFTVLVPPGVEGGAVEILAGEPETRSLLAALSDHGKVTLDARVLRDGKELDRLPLAALLARGASLAERPAELLPLRFDAVEPAPADEPALFAITAAGTDCSARTACMQECWNDYYDCVGYFCPSYSGSRFLPPECSFCEDERRTCQWACPGCICTEPKNVTYSTSVQMVSATWSGSGCFESYSGGPAYDYDRYWAEYKFTKYKHTEACDGTVTTTVDSVWYQYDYCWDRNFFQCSFPTPGIPYPSC
ncbi:MAG TPA: hypothetical protein VHQ65_12875 [Thermoanaerobaculia bacterium]|nr:hypothetical protein [Thermoanaerobaculia bacterium]